MACKRWLVCVAVMVVFLSGSDLARAVVLEMGVSSVDNTDPSPARQLANMPSPVADAGEDVLAFGGVQTSQLGAFNIVINAGATLAANAPAHDV